MAEHEQLEIDGEFEKVDEFGYTESEQAMIAATVSASFVRDYDGSRRKYADQVSTSEALIKRRVAGLNGHS